MAKSRVSPPPRKPWYAFECRYSDKAPVHQIQIRDADHNILLVTARYGEHSGAPLTERAMREVAKTLLEAVNKGEP